MTKDEAITAARLLREQERAVDGPERCLHIRPYRDAQSGCWHVQVGFDSDGGLSIDCTEPLDVLFAWHTLWIYVLALNRRRAA
jgi:hypothetical protein